MDFCPVGLTETSIKNDEVVAWGVALVFVILPLFLSGCFLYKKRKLDDMNMKECERAKELIKQKYNEVSFWGNAMSFLGAAIPIFIDVLVEDKIIKAVMLGISMMTLAILLFVSFKYASKVWECMDKIDQTQAG